MDISIQRVSRRNRRQVLELSLPEHQRRFVESPAQCLEEARRLWLWRPVAICAGDDIVGFAMYGRFPHEGGRVWLDRLLIGGEYQGRGYGKSALELLCAHIGKKYGCKEIYLSCYAENTAALALYRRAGFRENGEKDINGETVLVLAC